MIVELFKDCYEEELLKNIFGKEDSNYKRYQKFIKLIQIKPNNKEQKTENQQFWFYGFLIILPGKLIQIKHVQVLDKNIIQISQHLKRLFFNSIKMNISVQSIKIFKICDEIIAQDNKDKIIFPSDFDQVMNFIIDQDNEQEIERFQDINEYISNLQDGIEIFDNTQFTYRIDLSHAIQNMMVELSKEKQNKDQQFSDYIKNYPEIFKFSMPRNMTITFWEFIQYSLMTIQRYIRNATQEQKLKLPDSLWDIVYYILVKGSELFIQLKQGQTQIVDNYEKEYQTQKDYKLINVDQMAFNQQQFITQYYIQQRKKSDEYYGIFD